MKTLTPDHFAAFFKAVHGPDQEPFPWQDRLAALVMEKGWPAALDVPTGAGKTAAIDIAVFHLALEAASPEKRKAPVRILFVVDRRLVVDDAYRRAKELRDKLDGAEDGILKEVADRLRGLATSPGDQAASKRVPLVVSRLRGGTPRETDWALSPTQPTVVVSTVDQVGSRLLFRGYGVSDRMRSVHAGLLGTDALYLLDEAHLARPLVETIQGIQRWNRPRDGVARRPLTVCTLSATQLDEAPKLLKADDFDHHTLGRRLRASKPVDLVTAADEDELETKLTERAWKLSVCGGGTARTVAIVVNRVRRARSIHEILLKRAGTGDSRVADVALLTGRVRPIERDEALEKILPRMAAKRTEAQAGLPLLVVATQCIEAGADLDFDALVTEVAPLDSLRQRFGRLNRMGRPIVATGAVMAAKAQVSASAKPDPIYGLAQAETWGLLTSKAKKTGKGKDAQLLIDFGIEAAKTWLPPREELEKREQEEEAERTLVAPRPHAPVLAPVFLDRWSATSPAPQSEPEVALFLHGPRSGPAEVQMIWRLELPGDGHKPKDRELDEILERLEACPPSALEAMPLPFAEARRWLAGQRGQDFGDLEQSPSLEQDEQVQSRTERWALRWRGRDDPGTRVIDAGSVRPGDLLILPTTAGGCDQWGWNPGDARPVRDLGFEANQQQREKNIVRLGQEVFAQEAARSPGDLEPATRRWASALKSIDPEFGDQQVGLRLAEVPGLPERYAEAAKSLRDEESNAKLLRQSDGTPLVIVWDKDDKGEEQAEPAEPTTEDDSGSTGPRAVPLPEHSRGVREFAKAFVTGCGLENTVARDVELAAYLHDAGKGHPEFQCWLYGGDELAAAEGGPIAKSERPRLGKRARERSGLAEGARHEVASLAFALAHPKLREANDPELVLWLIGTHHGWGRPFFPPVKWPTGRFRTDVGDGERESTEPVQLERLMARWVDLQAELTKRYGHWGLAHLEAIVRLADHRRSQHEREQEKQRKKGKRDS